MFEKRKVFPLSRAKNTVRISCCYIILAFLFLVCFGSASVLAGEDAEFHFTVLFLEEDVTSDTEITIMKMPPVILRAGEEKIVSLPAGDYSVITMYEHEDIQFMPSQKKISAEAGEVKEITVELEPMIDMAEIMEYMEDLPDMEGAMPDMSGVPAMPGIPGIAAEEDGFDPDQVTDDELKNILIDKGEDAEIRRQAFDGLTDRRGIPFLIEMIKEEDDTIRIWSLEVCHRKNLGEKGPGELEKEGVIPDIIPVLEDPNPQARILAAKIMAYSWVFPEAALPPLIEGLDDPDPEVRAIFAFALGTGRDEATEAVKPLTALVEEDDSYKVRLEAVKALGSRGKSTSSSLAALETALGDKETEMRQSAMVALGRLEDYDEQRAVIAADALQDENVYIRRRAARIICTLDEVIEKVRPQMVAAVKDPDPNVRNNVFVYFRRLESRAQVESLDTLATVLLKDENPGVRETAARLIQASGSAAASIQPALNDALSDKEGSVVIIVARILLDFGRDQALPAIPRLVELLRFEDPPISHTVSLILRDIGAPAVQPLITVLDSDNAEARNRSATVLGWIGSPAEPAVPGLTAMFRDENEEETVRRAAYRALENITGEKPEL